MLIPNNLSEHTIQKVIIKLHWLSTLNLAVLPSHGVEDRSNIKGCES